MMQAEEAHKALGAALGRVPSGLFILTARHGDAETGLLASFVQQCGFDPPMVSAALRRDRWIIAWLMEGARFTLNILEDDQTDMIGHFGRGFGPEEPAFRDIDVERSDEDGPVLRDALAFLHCQVTARCPAGDHELLLALVVGGAVLNDGHPLVHIRRSGFHY